MTRQTTRRQFFELAGGGVGLALASSAAGEVMRGTEAKEPAQTESGSLNLLTDPRYQIGAKLRLQQFIRRGADPTEAEAIFRRLPDLEPQRWVIEWTRWPNLGPKRRRGWKSKGRLKRP